MLYYVCVEVLPVFTPFDVICPCVAKKPRPLTHRVTFRPISEEILTQWNSVSAIMLKKGQLPQSI